MSDRDRRATLRIGVRFGGDRANERSRRVELGGAPNRVLTGNRLVNENRYIRIDDAIGLFEVGHQVAALVQLSGCVPEHDVHIVRPSAFIPIGSLPKWTQVVATYNPITYGGGARALTLGKDVLTVINVTAFSDIWNTRIPVLAALIARDLVLGGIAVVLLYRVASSRVS